MATVTRHQALAVAVHTSIPSSVSQVQLVNENVSRAVCTIFNDATTALTIFLGLVADMGVLKSYTIAPGAVYTVTPGYTGPIAGVWAATPTGNAYVDEFI